MAQGFTGEASVVVGGGGGGGGGGKGSTVALAVVVVVVVVTGDPQDGSRGDGGGCCCLAAWGRTNERCRAHREVDRAGRGQSVVVVRVVVRVVRAVVTGVAASWSGATEEELAVTAAATLKALTALTAAVADLRLAKKPNCFQGESGGGCTLFPMLLLPTLLPVACPRTGALAVWVAVVSVWLVLREGSSWSS